MKKYLNKTLYINLVEQIYQSYALTKWQLHKVEYLYYIRQQKKLLSHHSVLLWKPNRGHCSRSYISKGFVHGSCSSNNINKLGLNSLKRIIKISYLDLCLYFLCVIVTEHNKWENKFLEYKFVKIYTYLNENKNAFCLKTTHIAYPNRKVCEWSIFLEMHCFLEYTITNLTKYCRSSYNHFRPRLFLKSEKNVYIQ